MKIIKLFAVMTLSVASSLANAELISGTHTITGTRTVALQGLEWLSLEHTAGLSRTDIEGGFTDRYGTVWGAGDWTYATRAQTSILLKSLWGGTHSGWSADNYDGAQWFKENFGLLGYDPGLGPVRTDKSGGAAQHDYGYFVYGTSGECPRALAATCFGLVQLQSESPHRNGYIHATHGLNKATVHPNTTARGAVYKYTGSLLVRPTRP